jgi:cation-transporting P-type ATPase 13A2
VPGDYTEQLKYYTHHGYRVLAVAWKIIPELLKKRSLVEQKLSFLGFIIFENKLKPGTTRVVETLSHAGIRQVMCTGDNLLTSISVSRECGLIHPSRTIYVPRFVSGQSHEEDAVIEWEDVDETGQKLDPTTFLVRLV